MSTQALAQSAFLLLAMGIAGAAHVLWLRSGLSARFARPVDAGRCFRGHRLFGDNKQVRGFMVLPLATALSFVMFGHVRPILPHTFSAGLWELGDLQYAGLGLACGLAFMLAELPNSFLKRRLGIAPGAASRGPWLGPLLLVIDRLDSVLGVLLVLSVLVTVPWGTWCIVLLAGPVVHAVYSIVLHAMGVKERAL
jgi:hypothetical protein